MNCEVLQGQRHSQCCERWVCGACVARIARVHQEGLTDPVRPGGPKARYDKRVLLGFTKRKKGSKVHMAVDTLGHVLAMQVTPADEQERA